MTNSQTMYDTLYWSKNKQFLSVCLLYVTNINNYDKFKKEFIKICDKT